MRPFVLALALVLVAAPLVWADATSPPVLTASPAVATLGEPVTFTATRDGAPIAATWTFTDGRSVTGVIVTRAFDFAGVHTIGAVVDGAGSPLEVQVLVLAPLLHGRAYAAHVAGTTFADTGDIATNAHADHGASVGEVERGQLRAAALDSELRTLDERAVARAEVGHVHIPLPIGFLRLTDVQSHAIVRCDGSMLHSHVGQVRLNDAPIFPPGQAPPNTRVELPGGGALILNAQEAPAPDRLGVTAARVLLPGQAPLEFAHVEAGVSHCPWDG